MGGQSFSQAADSPKRIQRQIASAQRKAVGLPLTIDLCESTSVVSSANDGNCDNGDTNSLKRKYNHAFSEAYGSSFPTTLARPLQPYSIVHAEPVACHSAASHQNEKVLGVQRLTSEPLSELANAPPTQLAESLDGRGSPESSDIWKAFPEITSHQRSHIQRTVGCLFRDDLATFLDKHCATWNNSGSWNGPVKDTGASSKLPPEPNRAGPTTYLHGMQNYSDTYDLELRIARVQLFLSLQQEIMRECRRTTKKKIAKSNAISNLCHSKGLELAEKTKLHQLFLYEKRIGGYWWWCVSFFGPSFLLRCRTKAGKSIVQNKFPLDAMIAYALHEYPHTAKPHALDAAVMHLLMTGSFPDKFLQQGGATEMHGAHADAAVTPAFRFFSTKAAEDDAISCLRRWSTNPDKS